MFSCDNLELDLQDNPNAVAPENAEIVFLYNNIQLSFETFFSAADVHAPAARMWHSSAGFTYGDQLPPATYNFLWTVAYANLLPDLRAMIDRTDLQEDGSGGLSVFSGSSRIMLSYVMTTLVDMFNDVPYTQAGLGAENFSPGVDEASTIYAAADELLRTAIADLENTDLNSTFPNEGFDNFYDGDAASWATLAKTLRMRIALNTDDWATFDQIVADGDFIDDNGKNWEYSFGTNRTNPGTRHDFYYDAYENNDATYMSNYYMWLLRSEKGQDVNGIDIRDPRINFYFYRQDGNLTDNDVNEFSCVLSDLPDILVAGQNVRPQKYIDADPDMPYCIVSVDGYYGRDHLNGSGIPPDGPTRTVWGLYPVGGNFDDDLFGFTQNAGTDGALGEGIWPMLQASHVHMMRAERALRGTGPDEAAALTHMVNGINASMDRVFDFTSLIDVNKVVGTDVNGNDILLQTKYLDDWATKVTDYIQVVTDRWTASTDKIDVLAKEFHIALWGNGHDAYNLLRRTGAPRNVQPGIDLAPGTFVNAAFYPASFVNLNSTINENRVLGDDYVFWADQSIVITP